MTDLKKFLTVDGGSTRNSASLECGLFCVGCPMLSWSAFTACCVELSDGVLWAKAYFVGDVVWVPCNMRKVFDLSAFDIVGQFFCISVLIYPRVEF